MLDSIDRLTPDPKLRGATDRTFGAKSVIFVAILPIALTVHISNTQASPRAKPNQIQYGYVTPKDPAHQALHDQLKRRQALEHLRPLSSG
jgi:hypothetical protein